MTKQIYQANLHVQVVLVKLNNMKDKFIENTHYYLDNGRVIFTELFHIERGQCCGNGCRHCPYEPKYQKGNKILWEKTNQQNTNS